jgi:hypothetical protein
LTQSGYTNSFCADDSFTVKAMKNLADLPSASAARNPQQAAIAFETEAFRMSGWSKRERACRRIGSGEILLAIL